MHPNPVHGSLNPNKSAFRTESRSVHLFASTKTRSVDYSQTCVATDYISRIITEKYTKMHQIQQEFSERHMAVLLVTKTICTKIPASIQLSLAARRLQDSAAKVITSINNSSTVRFRSLRRSFSLRRSEVVSASSLLLPA